MPVTTTHQYLEMLRGEHTTAIALIVGLVVGGVMPWMPGVTVVFLAYGMYLRTKRCRTLPDRSGLLDGGPLTMVMFPLWPLFVSVDFISDWMREVGFGATFRVAVTAMMFTFCWLPFIDWSLFPIGLVLISSLISALLRARGAPLILTLAPSLIPIAIVIQRWSL